MKYTRELTNGFIIFLCIGVYFIILELLGMSDVFLLRIVNIVFVVYGINRTIKANYESGVRGYFTNLTSAIITSMFGAILSIVALMIYIEVRGGEEYMQNLAENYLFGGSDLSIAQYGGGLLLESTAASLIASFCLMQYWKDKVEVINKVD